ncbi:MAG TPA: ATP synthase F1 subunit delta [Thermoleophilaceae bacterium]|nr:ATP synthase F1 subunit delta [Thermoleophilaceae bacterium]
MEEIADVYSRSLFEVAREQDKLDRVRDELAAVADALEQNRELSVFFFSPYFSTEEKKEGLRRTVVEADPAVVNFLELLIEKHRMPVLFRIRRQFDTLYDRAHKRLPVEVTSAVELDGGVIGELERRIHEQTGQNVHLESTVDPDILGGIVLRVGNSILDASIRHRLEQLRREVAKAA